MIHRLSHIWTLRGKWTYSRLYKLMCFHVVTLSCFQDFAAGMLKTLESTSMRSWLRLPTEHPSEWRALMVGRWVSCLYCNHLLPRNVSAPVLLPKRDTYLSDTTSPRLTLTVSSHEMQTLVTPTLPRLTLSLVTDTYLSKTTSPWFTLTVSIQFSCLSPFHMFTYFTLLHIIALRGDSNMKTTILYETVFSLWQLSNNSLKGI